MARLGVNVDHAATLRQARRTYEPDPVTAAALAEMHGADGITVHLREDRRHIQDRDLKLLKETVTTQLNLEMAATDEMVKVALFMKPEQVTLVPERRQEVTTEGGLNVQLHKDTLKRHVAMLRDGGIRVATFVDPDVDQLKASHLIGADAIEIHTGRYANAPSPDHVRDELKLVQQAVKAAGKLKLDIHAGHGLTYHNIHPLAAIDDIEEFNIGHSIIARAVFVGIGQAVREMADLVHRR